MHTYQIYNIYIYNICMEVVLLKSFQASFKENYLSLAPLLSSTFTTSNFEFTRNGIQS